MNPNYKTVSLNISEKQYNHLNELARLVETVTDVPTDAEAIATKLFTRALTGFNLGKLAENETELDEKFEQVEPETDSDNSTNADGFEEPEEQKVVPEETDLALPVIATEPVEKAKASPLAISPVVASLENHAEKRQEESEQSSFDLTGQWGKLLGRIECGSAITIVANQRHQATHAALSLCHELNRNLNVLYIAPSIVGDYNELSLQVGIDNEPRPHKTKIIHYCPDNLAEWKRQLFDEAGKLKYQAVVTDTAYETGLSLNHLKISFLIPMTQAKELITVSSFITTASVTQELICNELQDCDVVLRIAGDDMVFVRRKKSTTSK